MYIYSRRSGIVGTKPLAKGLERIGESRSDMSFDVLVFKER